MQRQTNNFNLNYILLIILFSLCIHQHLFADLGSESPTINQHICPDEWVQAGLVGGDLNADYPVIAGTIYVDDPDDIQDEIDDVPSNSGIWKVMLQPGTYVLNSPITMKSDVILAGPYLTKENKDEDDRAIIEFNLSNSELNCIVFDETISNAGIEDVYIKRIDTSGDPGGTQTGNNIYLFNCNNCFVSGVESYYPQNHHVTMYNCDHIEVRGCYFHEAQDYGELGDGYGAVCDYSNYCLIENNIFDHLRHSMLLQNDSKYNVFGYNYSIRAKQTNEPDLPEHLCGDMVCHGNPDDISGPSRNLFEGNIGQFLWVDMFHGCNGEDNTFHRNKAQKHGYWVAWYQKSQNIVNNFLNEGDRWLHLFGLPRLRINASTYFESCSFTQYRDLWGRKREYNLLCNNDLLNADGVDIWSGPYYITFIHDESYYIEGHPDLLCTSWPFNPKEDDNSAKLRYNIGGWKHTKSRYDNSMVARYFVLDQDIVVADPPTLPDFMNQDDWKTYDGDLVIPDTVCLIVNPGITLEFAADKCMYVHGSLVAKGTDHEDGEIKFKSSGSECWFGINITKAGDQIFPCGVSEFEYCSFTKTKNISGTACPYTYCGGAISANFVSYRNSPDIIIRNCVFYNNHGERGGAIYALSSQSNMVVKESITIIIEDCEIRDNKADDYGGGICLWNCDVLVRNNLIYENDDTDEISDLDGAGLCLIGCEGDIVNNAIFNNVGGENSAAGLFFSNSNLNIINNTVYGNCHHKSLSDIGGQLFDNEVNIINNVAGQFDFWYWSSQPHDFYLNFYNNYYIYSTYNLTCHITDGDGVGYSLQNFLNYYPERGNFVNNIYQQMSPPAYPGILGGDDPLYFCSLQDYSDLINRGITEDEFLLIDELDIDDWNKIPSQDPIENPRIAEGVLEMGAYEYYNPGIYLTQQEIDFGSVRHDRTSIQDLIIKNIGADDLTDIEITFADTIAEYYTIDPDDIPDVIPPSQTDSVCIPIKFCCHKMFVNCDGIATITSSDPFIPEVQMMVYGKPALDNYWNWISFPALDRDDSGNQDAEEVLEPLVPNAHQLITIDGDMIYNGNYWDHNYLDDIVSTVGYKLEMFKNYDYYPFSMVGDSITLIPADTEIYLEEGYNWIGYWLPQSQNFDEAFGINTSNNHFDKVLSIQAENWYYQPEPVTPEKDIPGQSQIIPSSRIHPLHYGRGYIVEMYEPIYLVWNDPDGGNTKEESYAKTEAFSFDEKETYEVIDVIGLDGSAIEIGVFNTDDECLGAAKIDSLGSAQILAYTDTQAKEGTELTFCIYQGKSIKESNNYLLYDFKSQEFIKAPLKAGMRKYNIVLFDSNNPQILDKLILRQNIPNPFNHKMKNTSISFALPQKDKVMLKIYNIKGQLVKTVIDNKEMDAGYYTVQWDGRNEDNMKVCNGVYLYKIENSNSSIIKKMIILE